MPHKLATHDLPPPAAPFYGSAGSPSTRYSDSPGPFSDRTSTPTSVSSYSPGLSTSSRVPPRGRHSSPTRTRPPVTRRAGNAAGEGPTGPVGFNGLPSLRESLTSSSSGSTVKPAERVETVIDEGMKSSRRLSPPPPSPPLRKSSMKFSRARLGRDQHVDHPPSKREKQPQLPKPSSRNAKSSPIGPSNAGVRAPAPPRPSRDGAPDLHSQLNSPAPVIQSNLTGLPSLSHRKRTSVDLANKAPGSRKTSIDGPTSAADPVRVRQGAGSRLSSRNPSPSPSSLHVQPPALAQSLNLEETSSRRPSVDDNNPMRSNQPPHTSPAKSISRFGLFTRRARPIVEPTGHPGPTKLTKKGPAAGTGHEGYGKHAKRGRSGSVTSASGSWARANSSGSTGSSVQRGPSSRKGSLTSKSEHGMDDFLSDRLSPVVMAGGGGIVENHNMGADLVRTESNQSSLAGRPSVDSNHSGSTQFSSFSNSSTRSRESSQTRSGLTPLRAPPGIMHDQSPGRTSQGGVKGSLNDGPTLAARRSLHRSQLLTDVGPLKIPPPINTLETGATPPSSGSFDNTLCSSVAASDDACSLRQEDVSEGKEGNWLKPRILESFSRSKSPRKWNFLQRAQEATHTPSEVVEPQPTVTRRAPTRPVAHYALPESSTAATGTEALTDLMRDTTSPSDTADEEYLGKSTRLEPELQTAGRGFSTLLPDPPVLPVDFRNPRPASPKVMLRTNESPSRQPTPAVEDPPPKRSRLAQVGRIPRVVSTRDRERNGAVQAVPRVYAQQLPTPLSTASTPFLPPPAILSRDGSVSSVIAAEEESVFSPASLSVDDLSKDATKQLPSSGQGQMMAERDNNEFLVFPPRKRSELSSSSSSGMFNTPGAYAWMLASRAPPSEDEVWGEYDDLIDDIFSPGASNTSLSSPEPRPEQTGRRKSRRKPPPLPSMQLSPGIASSYVASIYSPGTPMSFTDFFAGYGDRSSSVKHVSGTSRAPFRRSHLRIDSRDSISAPSSEDGEQEVTYQRKIESNGLDSEMNLRFGALMTSRWLSFGRVLFSPAHGEMQQGSALSQQSRLLVLDGLCNGRSNSQQARIERRAKSDADDWSFYCALTYPNASVYNLSPSRASSAASPQKRESGGLQSPSNHRQIYHPDIENPFPFPKGFFGAVIFRFPVAGSDLAYRNAISECKRVLRPGGHLEISVLDLDMMNMGNRARRAVRMLKVQMQVADCNVSLKPVSDNIQRLLGRRGFENVNCCALGVPVAGKVSRSRAGSRVASAEEHGLSLSELLRDKSQEGDEGITTMVAKVGRWWYTRCYEMGTLPAGDLSRSIWNDRALLRECEKRKTSFRLLICYAQKPLTQRRRTVSV